jgi:hypothetical protein
LAGSAATLAARRQGKFVEFHLAMIEVDSASEDVIKATSERLGLDYAKL